jgi:hypothetical protein
MYQNVLNLRCMFPLTATVRHDWALYRYGTRRRTSGEDWSLGKQTRHNFSWNVREINLCKAGTPDFMHFFK